MCSLGSGPLGEKNPNNLPNFGDTQFSFGFILNLFSGQVLLAKNFLARVTILWRFKGGFESDNILKRFLNSSRILLKKIWCIDK